MTRDPEARVRGGRSAVVAVGLLVLGLIAATLWATFAHRPPQTPPGPYRHLILSENFDGDLDRELWTDQRGLAPTTYGSPFNAELENTYFRPEQVRVRDGVLHLDARPGRSQDPLGGATYDYVSGVAHTGKNLSFTYGYAEARIRIPEDEAYWPAFWLLPSPVDSQWPPEIDIAEFSSVTHSTTRPSFNAHWKDAQGAHKQAGPVPYGDTSTDYRGSWHTYGVLWEPGRLQVFLDGKPGPVFTGDAVPAQPMHIVLGMGVIRDRGPAPASMEVDHVKVWSDSPTGRTFTE